MVPLASKSPGLKIATVNSVMGELLRNAPVKVLEIGARDDVRRVHRSGSQAGLKMNVVSKITR